MIGATGEPARDVLSKIVKALTGARVSYRLLSIPQGKGGTDYLLSMQYAGSAPWAKSAFEITGFPFGVTPLSDATSPIATRCSLACDGEAGNACWSFSLWYFRAC